MRDVSCPTRSRDVEWVARVTGVCGALLAGGASSRFGEDKFIYPVDGVAMGLRAARALGAIATEGCWLQGGRPEHASLTGLDLRIGDREGNGPLGALIDALEGCTADVLLSLPCDVPYIRADDLRLLCGGIDDRHDVAVAVSGDRQHWLVAAWRTSSHDLLRASFDAGERAVHRAASSLRMVEVPLDPHAVTNVNLRP